MSDAAAIPRPSSQPGALRTKRFETVREVYDNNMGWPRRGEQPGGLKESPSWAWNSGIRCSRNRHRRETSRIMCGIVGASWTENGPPLDLERLAAMTDRLTHRGPDERGVRLEPLCALGFRRLAILDVAGAHQPMSNEDGSIWVVFNGEIYNFSELRRRLEATGHVLRTRGDTEVLPHLYEDLGVNLFAELRGMFALAIWDGRRRKLILGRDRLGQKPLVYRHEPERLLFASEIKALLTLDHTTLPRDLDPIALDRYLTYGYVPAPATMLKGVRKLPAAHVLEFDARTGRVRAQRYWEPDWNHEQTNLSFPQARDRLRGLLEEAVREQMISEVPLGAFLSGGVDSTAIVGLMSRHQRATGGPPVRTFSIGFDDPAFDERRYAREAAEFLGTEHREFLVEPHAWQLLPELAATFDEPFADSSALPTYVLSRETRRFVTVALAGDAGDELFQGYDRYRALALTLALDRLPEGVRRVLAGPLARILPASARAKTRLRKVKRLLEAIADPVPVRYARWCSIFQESDRAALYHDEALEALAQASRELDEPDEADPVQVLARGFDAANARDPLTGAMVADLLAYLPGDLLVKVDLASMAHSLECRAPLLDHRVVEFALSLPTRFKRRRPWGAKAVFKASCADLLPASIRSRSKMGFGVPIDRWFRGPLADELQAILLDPSSLNRRLFQPQAVKRLVNDHLAGRADHAYRLWALIMLELWFRRDDMASHPLQMPCLQVQSQPAVSPARLQ